MSMTTRKEQDAHRIPHDQLGYTGAPGPGLVSRLMSIL